MEPDEPKPVEWLGSTLKDVAELPVKVRRVVGFALYLAQTGQKHPDTKPLQGFGGAGVLEIVESYETNAYRAVYTVRFEEAVYVLHVFQKKSMEGVKTPQRDINLIRERLRQAQQKHEAYLDEMKQAQRMVEGKKK